MPQVPKRPCTLPSIQIDTWGTAVQVSQCLEKDVQCLAQELCTDTHLLLLSVLQNTRAVTIVQLAETAAVMHLPLQAVVRDGQVYMHDKWRIRYSDMKESIRKQVNRIPDGTCVNKEFQEVYNPTSVYDLMLQFVGPARSAGIRSLRCSHWHNHLDRPRHDQGAASERNHIHHDPQTARLRR